MTEISLESFEKEAGDFLDANASKKEAEHKFVWGEGSDKVAMFEETQPHRRAQRPAQGLRHGGRKKFDAGFGWITGPVEYGGRGLPDAYETAWNALEAQYQVPNQSAFTIGLGMVAPTILAHGSDVGQGRLPRARCTAPTSSAASCSASPAPAATWPACRPRPSATATSGSSPARRCGPPAPSTATSARSSPAPIPTCPSTRASPASSSTCRRPGVEVRPLRQMTGGASFNEVFFNEVRVPDDHRLGDVNNGWNVALTTLMNERAAIGAGGGGGGGVNLYARVIEMVRHFGLDDDPLVRDELADLIIHSKVAGYNNQRAMDKIKAGQLPGPEMCIAKLAGTMNMRRARRLRVARARPEADRRHRRVGHLRLEPARARHARRPHRRRQRRGHAQHRRRAGARPAEGRRASTRRRRSAT